MKKLLVFDLDGTLIDTLADLATALNRTLVACGEAALPVSHIRRLIGEGSRHLITRALPASRHHEVESILSRFLDHYRTCQHDTSRLFPGVQETLAMLETCPMAVATNKPEEFARDQLAWCGIAHHFPVVVGGDTLACRKPDPRFLEAVRRQFAPDLEACWMVGDGELDILAGQAAGFTTIAVTFGFRDRADLEPCQPDHIVDRFEDIAPIIGVK